MAQRWKVLSITSVGLFMASLDLFIVNIAFPDLARDFDGASLPSLSWVLNAYAIVFAALLIPAGRIADRVGRKRVFVTGLTVFAAASGLCALSPSVAFLVAARILQATGGAMMIPATLGLILPAFPLEQRALAIGLLTALLAVRVLDEVREPEDGRPDLLGAAELALGIGVLTLGIVKGPEWGWDDLRTLGAFAGAVLLVAAFVRRSARHHAPVIELPLLRVRSFALANLAALVFFAGFGAMLLSGVLLLTEVWGYSALKAGFALSPGPLMAATFAIPSGRLGGRIGQRPVAVAGGLTFAAGFAYILATVGPSPEYASTFLPGFMLGGAGVGMTLGTLPAAAAAGLPPSRFATGTAVFSMARQLGAAIGVAALVALLNDSTGGDLLAGLQRGWWFSLLAGLGTAALALAIGPIAPLARVERPAAAQADAFVLGDPPM
jgi:MFS family permease